MSDEDKLWFRTSFSDAKKGKDVFEKYISFIISDQCNELVGLWLKSWKKSKVIKSSQNGYENILNLGTKVFKITHDYINQILQAVRYQQ